MLNQLCRGEPVPRPPYVPLIGTAAATLAQVPAEMFCQDEHTHARALSVAAQALHLDVVTVGVQTAPSTALAALPRLRGLLPGRPTAVYLSDYQNSDIRACCEAEADVIIVAAEDNQPSRKLRTVANVCHFYDIPVLLAAPGDDDETADQAASAGLDGAIIETPTGNEPGIIGGAIPRDAAGNSQPPTPPRSDAFFWSSPRHVAADAPMETLIALGQQLTRA